MNKPLVGIVMGSDSDWSTMEPAANVLVEFGISYEADVVSAHRMPEEMVAYGRGPTAVVCAASSPVPVVPPTCPVCWPPSPRYR